MQLGRHLSDVFMMTSCSLSEKASSMAVALLDQRIVSAPKLRRHPSRVDVSHEWLDPLGLWHDLAEMR